MSHTKGESMPVDWKMGFCSRRWTRWTKVGCSTMKNVNEDNADDSIEDMSVFMLKILV